MIFIEVSKSSVCLSLKPFFSSKNASFKRNMFDYDVIMTSSTPYNTYPRLVINGAKFHACTSGSFEELRTPHTHRIALYSTDDGEEQICLDFCQTKIIARFRN